jgi:glycosyltransferase involved in cell wall biosynthesis
MKKTLPLVSIIIPTKNSAQTLDACLQSIKNQSYSNTEIIVVDNQSQDKTKHIALNYTNKVYDHGPERCAQRNCGAAKAVGDYYLFIDSDMEVGSDVVSACVKTTTKDEHLIAMIIPEESFGQGFWSQCKRLEKSFYVGVDWIEAARFFNKHHFHAVGGYDENLVSAEDWDLSQRIGSTGKIGRVGEYIRHNEGNIDLLKTCRKKFYYARNVGKYLRKNPSNAAKQINVLSRYALYFGSPTTVFRHPILGIGLLWMKTCEFGCGLAGLLVSHADNWNKPPETTPL